MWILIYLLIIAVNTLIIITIIDVIFMGGLSYNFSSNCKKEEFLIERPVRIDFQSKEDCAGYSVAYLLRFIGIEANGAELYEKIPNRYQKDYVFPKGIVRLLQNYGIKIKYKVGNLNSLKNEVAKGNPVIIMIRSRIGQSYFHFVNVVGYDKNYIYIADSFKDFANCEYSVYNRKIDTKTFMKLWNTSSWICPLYFNTYFSRIIG